VERLPAEHPAASGPPGRVSGEPEGHPGGVGTMTLQRPPEPSPDDVPAGATPEPVRQPRSRGILSPRHWKVRTKLAAVLLVPAIAFLVLASINMGTQIGNARDYGRGANVAEFGRQASALAHELQAERDIAAGWVAEGRPPDNSAKIKAITDANDKIQADNAAKGTQNPTKTVPLASDLVALKAQQSNVDAALSTYQSADASLGDLSPEARSAVDAARVELAGLSQLRQALDRQLLTQGAIGDKYSAMIARLLDINRQIGAGTGNTQLNNEVAGLTALSDLKETLSKERALLYSVTSNGGLNKTGDGREPGRFQFGQQQDFSSAVAERLAALQRFRTAATPNQVGSYDAQVNGQAVLAVKRLEDTITAEQTGPLSADAEQWYSAATTYLQAMRGVETGLLDQVASTTRNLRSDAQRQAITTGVIIAAILVIAFLTSLLIARSMIGPLRRLQAGARDVAEVRLPEAIARLQRPDAPAAPDEVEPIGIDSRDEIGDVAKTFDQLHQRAVELASEQAGLRRNVNDMFVNLSRRSQGLVERQLKLIDELETGEQDPDQLANLFKLDHLATRMRRNSENLLVLAGEDAGRRWGRPIPLVDVLRAATSEVEQYHRIQLTGVPDVEVMGHAVNHLVHLVAELLENATVFSSPESKVLVHSQRLSDGGAMVEIEDRGIGMSPHEISDANERLAHPPEFDVSVSRMMGLYVVGRLATRHGITVRLRQSETGGVSAFVRIPMDVLANRFAPQSDDTAGGQPPMVAGPDGRTGRPAAIAMPPAPGPQQPGPRPLGPGPAGDLPRRPLGRPGGPGGPGGPVGLSDQPIPSGPPLPRRTPAQAGGGDGASAGGVEGGVRPDSKGGNALPVNGAMPAKGMPSGRPVLPPGQAGPGRPGGPVPPGDLPPRPPLPMRGAPDGGAGPRPIPPLAAAAGRPATPGPLDQPYPQPAAGAEERTPIFEQLQSEWFRQRPASARPAPPPGAPAPAAGAQQPAPAPAPDEEAWASPADEGWRAAERLLQPTSGGTTRAGLPMRVPQAHLMPGGADVPSAAPPEPVRPAYRSPEAVRSRLASYHQGVRRGRHADRADDGDNRANPSELVQQSQEKS
jgi:signal transduction histidine kinase